MFNGSTKLLVASLLSCVCLGAGLSSCKSSSGFAEAKKTGALSPQNIPAAAESAAPEETADLPEPPVAAPAASAVQSAPEPVALPKPSGVIANLYLMDGIEIPSVLRYSSDVVPAEGDSSTVQKFRVSRVRPRREDAELAVGGIFQNRYVIDSHSATSGEGESAKPATLVLKDTLNGSFIVLPFQVEVENPKRFGDFELRGDTNARFQYQEGDIFKLPNDKKTDYQLIGFDPGGALLRKVKGGDVLRVPVPSAPASAPAELLPEE